MRDMCCAPSASDMDVCTSSLIDPCPLFAMLPDSGLGWVAQRAILKGDLLMVSLPLAIVQGQEVTPHGGGRGAGDPLMASKARQWTWVGRRSSGGSRGYGR